METKTPQSEQAEKELKQTIVSMARAIFHQPTPQHSNKKRGVGITRKSREQTKKAKKLAKLQRATNRKMANKKSRPTGSKRRV